MSTNALELRSVTRTYRQGDNDITPLKDFSLEIKQGEIVALVGPSGSGKSTLLQIAGLLDNPTSGEVVIGGQVMGQATDRERTDARKKYLGFVYQFHHLLPEFSALENVVLPQMIAGVSRAQAEVHALAKLSALGLGERASHRPAKLSGGEQQRVAIARALINNPHLLLADEPTGNLDPSTSEQVFYLLVKHAREQGLATLVATHNMELAGRMDRIVRLG